jgi:RES domain-containing protein
VTLSAWRIVKARHASTAFDGEGAAATGGRWNSPGTRVVYTAESTALAILEMLAHLGSPAPLPAYVVIECRFDASLVTAIADESLPSDWRSYPAPAALQVIGDRWARDATSAILSVPSVVAPGGRNYLLNPAHPDFTRIQFGDASPLAIDRRLAKK